MKKYIFYAIFMASIIANIVFFLSDGILYLRVRWNRHIENNYSEKCKDIKDFRDNIYKAGLDIVKNGESVVVPARVGLFTKESRILAPIHQASLLVPQCT